MNQIAMKLARHGYPAGFFRWLESNQHIYQQFVALALQMKRSGRSRYSARTIIHKLRWDTELADSEATFKINNNYTPGMARLAMSEWPELDGFFETRGNE